MKVHSTNFLFGIFLVLIGAFFLLTTLGKLDITEEYSVSIFFASAGIVLILAYILFHQKLWTLIVGAICFFIGSAVFIEESRILPDESIGALLFIIMGILFLTALLKGKKNWWAVLPGGFSFILAGHVLIEMSWRIPHEYHGVLFLGGWGLIFGIVYLLKDDTYHLNWAKYPCIVLLILAAFALFSVDLDNFMSRLIVPIIMIAIGGYVVFRAIQKEKLLTKKDNEKKDKNKKG
ncbi:hypothetical protein ACFL6A_03520 [bacterium]